VDGVTVKNELDESTGLFEMIVVDHKEDLHPQLVILDPKTKDPLAYYAIPTGAHIVTSEGDLIVAGGLLAKTPRKIIKTKDITGGLPRVAELFEARHPKDAAEISRIDGIVEFGEPSKGKRRLIVRDPETGVQEEHLIPFGKHLMVYKGDLVKKGQQLTEGPVAPQEILMVGGMKELQEYLLNQVQEVYRLQGVNINYKHVEIIIRQMLRKVRITDPGGTRFLFDDMVDRLEFDQENQTALKDGKKTAEASPLLMGITKASLSTDSFISAASFQETTRVLTDATSNGRIDKLMGFKENVIMGRIIPAGTGFRGIQKILYDKTILDLNLQQEPDFNLDEIKNMISDSAKQILTAENDRGSTLDQILGPSTDPALESAREEK
jgi:DNA-directed RNA polymerase subunit beta'